MQTGWDGVQKACKIAYVLNRMFTRWNVSSSQSRINGGKILPVFVYILYTMCIHLYIFFFFFLNSMFISVEDRTGRIRFSYNYSMIFTCSQ